MTDTTTPGEGHAPTAWPTVTLDSPAADIRAAWVAALRSGQFTQAQGQLRSSAGHCCLGVLCEVVGLQAELTSEGFAYGEDTYSVLPPRVWEAVGLQDDIGGFKRSGSLASALTEENDSYGRTFAEIATIIETEPSLWVESSAL